MSLQELVEAQAELAKFAPLVRHSICFLRNVLCYVVCLPQALSTNLGVFSVWPRCLLQWLILKHRLAACKMTGSKLPRSQVEPLNDAVAMPEALFADKCGALQKTQEKAEEVPTKVEPAKPSEEAAPIPKPAEVAPPAPPVAPAPAAAPPAAPAHPAAPAAPPMPTAPQQQVDISFRLGPFE